MRRLASVMLMSIAIAPSNARAQATLAADTTAQRAGRIVAADEAARVRGDSAAWTRVAPGFLFVHSTGQVDDLAAFHRWRAAGAAASARNAGGGGARRRPVGAAIERIEDNVLVRVRMLGDSVPPGGRAGQSRVTDVFVRRADGAWHWLAHQTAEVSPRWTPRPVPAAELAAYAGTYVAPSGQRRIFAVRGDSLVQVTSAGPGTVPAEGAATRRLTPLGTASFGYEGLNATLTFVRDATGRVTSAAESSQVAFVEFARAP